MKTLLYTLKEETPPGAETVPGLKRNSIRPDIGLFFESGWGHWNSGGFFVVEIVGFGIHIPVELLWG